MLIITVHYPQRELIPKLLLAHKAASRCGASIIGRTGAIRKKNGQVLYKKLGPFKRDYRIHEGLVLEMATTHLALLHIAKFRKEGFSIASFCEEATAFSDPVEFATRRLAESTINNIDFLISWGKWHQQAISTSSIDDGKVSTTGHPRFEIYQEKFKQLYIDNINCIENKYGQFILINTNITEIDMLNDGVEKRLRQLEEKLTKTGKSSLSDIGQSEETLLYGVNKKRKAFANQVLIANNIVNELGESNVKIVMRPKPSVSVELLSKYAKDIGYSGHVDGAFSVTPWLHACSGVLHHSCTTAIEAALAKKAAVMLLDDGDDKEIARPVKDASFCVKSINEASELLIDSVNNKTDLADLNEKYKSVKYWHKNIDTSPSDAVIDEIIKRGLINLNDDQGIKDLRFKRIIPKEHCSSMPIDNSKRGIDGAIDSVEVINTIQELNSILNKKISVEEVDSEIYILRS